MAELVHAYNDKITDTVILNKLLEQLYLIIPEPFKVESTNDCNAAAWLYIFTKLNSAGGPFSDERFETIVKSAKKKFGSFKDTPELAESAIIEVKVYDTNVSNLLVRIFNVVNEVYDRLELEEV